MGRGEETSRSYVIAPARVSVDEPPPRWSIEIKPKAERALARLPAKDRQRVADKINALAADPCPHGVEKLSGSDDLYRIRSGDYRIVYQIQDAILLILVLRVAHRREAYRHLTDLLLLALPVGV